MKENKTPWSCNAGHESVHTYIELSNYTEKQFFKKRSKNRNEIKKGSGFEFLDLTAESEKEEKAIKCILSEGIH